MKGPELPMQLPLPMSTDTGFDDTNGVVTPSASSAFPSRQLPHLPPFPPRPLPHFPPRPLPHLRSLRSGAWLVNYQPVSSSLVAYDGTIRVESHSQGRTASGDLYQRPVINLRLPPNPPRPFLLPGPSPTGGIPILARDKYRYYLSITKFLENFTIGDSFVLGFQMWRFDNANNSFNPTAEGSFSATMTWITAPPGYPDANSYVEGDLSSDATGAVTGRLKMGWVSASYRKATIEIDTVAGSERPSDSGLGQSWATVFSALGWDVTVIESDNDIPEPSGDSWSDAELHAAMLAHRDRINLDVEWRYHLLMVKLLDSTPRGLMYDVGATDSDNVPREGVGISSNYIMTAEFGRLSGKRFDSSEAKPAYFRTAIHELGHAMGLYHNVGNLGATAPYLTLNALERLTLGTPADCRSRIYEY